MLRHARANSANSSAFIVAAVATNTSSLRAYSGSRLRTIGARTSTCAHDIPRTQRPPVRSWTRVKRPALTNRDAATPEIGARCANHDRGLNAPSSAQSARASHSATERMISAWSRSATSSNSTRCSDRAEPDHSRRSSASSSLTARRICSIGSSPNMCSILPKGTTPTRGHSELVRHPLDALPCPVPEVHGQSSPEKLEVPRDRSEVVVVDEIGRAGSACRTGVDGSPTVGQAPSARTVDGDRNRSQVAHHGTVPFQHPTTGASATGSGGPGRRA